MFKLSKLTDYAAIILSTLDKGQDVPVSVATIAETANLPEPTVSKVLKLLCKAGLVKSMRGATGGYRMNGTLDHISVLDLVIAIEGPLSIVACVDSAGEGCMLEQSCMMRGRWDPVNEALKDALGSVSLRDINERRVNMLSKAGTQKNYNEERIQ